MNVIWLVRTCGPESLPLAAFNTLANAVGTLDETHSTIVPGSPPTLTPCVVKNNKITEYKYTARNGDVYYIREIEFYTSVTHL